MRAQLVLAASVSATSASFSTDSWWKWWRTRVPFQALPDYLKAGDTLDEFLEDFPSVSRHTITALEDAKAALVGQLG